MAVDDQTAPLASLPGLCQSRDADYRQGKRSQRIMFGWNNAMPSEECSLCTHAPVSLPLAGLGRPAATGRASLPRSPCSSAGTRQVCRCTCHVLPFISFEFLFFLPLLCLQSFMVDGEGKALKLVQI